MSSLVRELKVLSSDLSEEISRTEDKDDGPPDPARTLEIIRAIGTRSVGATGNSRMTVAVLAESGIGKVLSAAMKSVRRYRRAEGSVGLDGSASWAEVAKCGGEMLRAWKKAAADGQNSTGRGGGDGDDDGKGAGDDGGSSGTGLPRTVGEYRARLVRQKKDLYKDPPKMPLTAVEVDKKRASAPVRKKNGDIFFSDWEEFRPNVTPAEVLRAGSFGGTYFRSIISGVTNEKYSGSEMLAETCPADWTEGLDAKTRLTSATYRPSLNKFGVKCGGSLGMWESSGWISDVDPYGWFQWYCRFYRGRRCSDDARQIGRWSKSAGPRGRFRSQLLNKCLAAGKGAGDVSISPVIRQTLLHWGFMPTEEQLERHRKNKK